MSGAGQHIPAQALRIVFRHRRPEVLQYQLREIDTLVGHYNLVCREPRDPHLGRMRQRARALHSIEYCEDVIMHVNAVIDREHMRRVADDDAVALCHVICNICEDVEYRSEDPDSDPYERIRDTMNRVLGLFDVLVEPQNIRPWAREHLDLHRLANWHQRRDEPNWPTITDFSEIREVLMARTTRPVVRV